MKKKCLFILSVLFLQTVSANTLSFNLIENVRTSSPSFYEAKFKIIDNKVQPPLETIKTIPLQKVEHIGFEPPAYSPVPNDLSLFSGNKVGSVQKKIRCSFSYNGQNYNQELIEPRSYPLWGFVEYKQQNSSTSINLFLKTQLEDGAYHTVTQAPVATRVYDKQLIDSVKETGFSKFDGLSMYNILRIRQIFSDNQFQYVEQHNGEIDTHKGYNIIYVEPFSVDKQPINQPNDYIGLYNSVKSLLGEELHPTIREENLIYSDGKDFYLPRVTQELWKRQTTGRDENVSFFIASYKEALRVNLTPGVRLPNGRLQEGLYQFQLAKIANGEKVEEWKRLGSNPPTLVSITISKI